MSQCTRVRNLPTLSQTASVSEKELEQRPVYQPKSAVASGSFVSIRANAPVREADPSLIPPLHHGTSSELVPRREEERSASGRSNAMQAGGQEGHASEPEPDRISVVPMETAWLAQMFFNHCLCARSPEAFLHPEARDFTRSLLPPAAQFAPRLRLSLHLNSNAKDGTSRSVDSELEKS